MCALMEGGGGDHRGYPYYIEVVGLFGVVLGCVLDGVNPYPQC